MAIPRVCIGVRDAVGTIPETTGIFVSKAKRNAVTADHRNAALWIFNSNWGQTARVSATGVSRINTYILARNEIGTDAIFWFRFYDNLGSEVRMSPYDDRDLGLDYKDYYTGWVARQSYDTAGRLRFRVEKVRGDDRDPPEWNIPKFRYMIVQV